MIRMALLLIVVGSCGGSSTPTQSSKAMSAEENAALTASVEEAHDESSDSDGDTAAVSEASSGVCEGLDYLRACVDIAESDSAPCLEHSQVFLEAVLEGLELPADTSGQGAREVRGACNGLCKGKRGLPEATFEELCGALKEVAPDVFEGLPRIN